MDFLCRMAGLPVGDGVKCSVIWEGFRIDSLLRHVKKSQFRWFWWGTRVHLGLGHAGEIDILKICRRRLGEREVFVKHLPSDPNSDKGKLMDEWTDVSEYLIIISKRNDKYMKAGN